MKRLAAILFGLGLGLTATGSAASAAIVLDSGAYAANAVFDISSAEFSIPGVTAPGTYKFTLTVSSPLVTLSIADINKYPTFNAYCNFGDGSVYCGGDETPEDHPLVQVGPTTYTSLITLNPEHIQDFGGGNYFDFFDRCCDFSIEGQSGNAPGTYLFTVESVPVPEPGAWALMILGVGVVGGALRTAGTARLQAVASRSRR